MNISLFLWEINCWLALVAAVVATLNTQKDAEVLPREDLEDFQDC